MNRYPRISIAAVICLPAFLLAGCATPPAKVAVGGEARLSVPLLEPVMTNATGDPELAFCVDAGSGENARATLDRFRRHAPFRRIAPVNTGAPCEIHLKLVWDFMTGAGSVVATSVDDGRELLRAEAEGVWGPTFGVERLGPIVYNAFVPGSPLYRQLSKAREAAAEDWQETVRRYRAAAVKPALPEAARRFKVQAEAAVAQQAFAEAAGHYRSGLRLAPWWPEGRFNRALLLGETGGYREAIDEMQKYLALVPDAPDARAAQDKIYEWERLAGKTGAETAADSSPMAPAQGGLSK